MSTRPDLGATGPFVMHHFDYKDGVLHAEGVSLERIAAEIGTPFYCYSSATLERHIEVFSKAVGAPPARVFYAMKANSNLAVLRTLAAKGAGADTVSEGEIRKALAAGVPPAGVVFSGVGKSRQELAFAVAQGIYQVNVETEGELDLLSAVASQSGRRQAAVLRVNPDVGAGGHAKITTGSEDNKFGVSLADIHRLYTRGANLPGIRMLGLAVHIGSQIREIAPLEARIRALQGLPAVAPAVKKGGAPPPPAADAPATFELRKAGHKVERLDLGGGLGIPYEMPDGFDHGPELIEAYAAMVHRVLGDLDVELAFEPGRVIVGNAGILVARVLHLNARPSKTFAVVDAAMNDLVRPAMYGAHHEIWTIRQVGKDHPRSHYDVVGPICETGDTFAEGRRLPTLAPGDLIAFKTAGAYGAAMASSYNLRPLVPEVLVRGDAYAVVRPRQTFEELIGADRLPPWLG